MTAAEEERDEARRLHAEADLDAKVNRDTANRAEARLGKVRALAIQFDREAAAGGTYAELRRSHATRIREALAGDL